MIPFAVMLVTIPNLILAYFVAFISGLSIAASLLLPWYKNFTFEVGKGYMSTLHVCTTAWNLPPKEAEFGKSHFFQESFSAFTIETSCNDMTLVAPLLTDCVYFNHSCSLYIRLCR